MQKSPRIEIEYCTQCRWLLRAAWMAQELLTTFQGVIGGLALVPRRNGPWPHRSGILAAPRRWWLTGCNLVAAVLRQGDTSRPYGLLCACTLGVRISATSTRGRLTPVRVYATFGTVSVDPCRRPESAPEDSVRLEDASVTDANRRRCVTNRHGRAEAGWFSGPCASSSRWVA
jgi:selT/selW/selH-like putative selenoprotein